MKLLLVYPSTQTRGFSQQVALIEPLSLEYLAAGVPEEHEVRIVDLRLGRERLDEVITRWKPDMVGITGFTLHVPEMLSLSQAVKDISQDIKVIVGGHHATFMPDSFKILSVDLIARGECEGIMGAILESIRSPAALNEIPGLIYRSNGQWVTNEGWPPSHFQSLSPRRDLVKDWFSHYHAWGFPCSQVQATRGCPHRCKFCDASRFYQGQHQTRPVDKIVQEIGETPTKLVGLLDENIGVNSRFLENLISALRESGIKKRYIITIGVREVLAQRELLDKWFDLGLRVLFIGIERIEDEGIAGLGKKTTVSMNDEAISYIHSRQGIIIGSFIILPTDNQNYFRRLEEYIQSRGIDVPVVCALTPLPGTELWDEYQGKLDMDFSKYDFLHPVIPTSLPQPEFSRYLYHTYNCVNLRRLVWKMIRSMGIGRWLFRLPSIGLAVRRLGRSGVT
ncbi:hypothetical protein LCGC14_0263030 [marine sediment metagenome]|uniref:Uncharacterized protein n=1 Tax=marine sediment metagenome TaxID=412755 RepID=A0A0F9X619_9ZZZZ